MTIATLSRMVLSCEASSLTVFMFDEGLTLNSRCVVIQVWSSWYALNWVAFSVFIFQQTLHNNEFFESSICNFLQVLCLSSPTHDNNCCFLRRDALNRSLRTRSPRKTSALSVLCIHHVALTSSLNNQGSFVYSSINMYLLCAHNVSSCFLCSTQRIISEILFHLNPSSNSLILL